MTPQFAGVAVPQEDVAALVTLVAGGEQAQQNALPDAWTAPFRRERPLTAAEASGRWATLPASCPDTAPGYDAVVLAKDDDRCRVSVAVAVAVTVAVAVAVAHRLPILDSDVPAAS